MENRKQLKHKWRALKGRLFNSKGAKFSFAQAGEDIILQRIFLNTENGFYVDVGAYHPYQLSNTYLFYLNGWRGINIEPRPKSKQLFDKVRPRDINLELGVAEVTGLLKYYLFEEDTLNQFELTESQLLSTEKKMEIAVQVEPLSSIFRKHLPPNSTIDFLTIDTEGAEYEVLKSIEWKEISIKVILLEQNVFNKKFDAAADFLRKKGYSEAYRIPVNEEAASVFFIKDEA